MITRELLHEYRDQILTIARRHGAHDVRIFGSVSRGESDANSDLDLVVRFESGRSLMDHGMLIEDLQDLLGVKVDVVSERGLRDRLRARITRDAVPL